MRKRLNKKAVRIVQDILRGTTRPDTLVIPVETPKETLRTILDRIDHDLSGEYGEKLWQVLSALRGPDRKGDLSDVKYATTSVIRRKAFPKTFAPDSQSAVNSFMAIARSDSQNSLGIRTDGDLAEAGTHFAEHAVAAFEALGMKWEYVNY